MEKKIGLNTIFREHRGSIYSIVHLFNSEIIENIFVTIIKLNMFKDKY